MTSRFHLTVAAVLDVTVTAVTCAAACSAWANLDWPSIAVAKVGPFSRRDILVATGVFGLKNVTQFVAIVFAVPVRPAGMPGAGLVALAAGEAAAEAEGVAGADEDDELGELLHAAAVSARQATPAAATSDCHLDRRIFIRKQASP